MPADAGLRLKQVLELCGLGWMKPFYEQWSKNYLNNLVISHLINKNCVRRHLYWGTEAETGQEGCLLKETVLKIFAKCSYWNGSCLTESYDVVFLANNLI